jgi:predicted phage-related endonuclease
MSAKQRSNEWFELRRGRFTASRASEMLTNGSRQMTDEEMIAYKEAEPKGRKKTIAIVGESLETYAFEKAIEDLFGLQDHSDDYISKDMQRGIDEEPLAFAMFSRKKALDFIDVEESEFCCYGDHAGASPDGVVSNNSGLEIKCPKRLKFFKIVANGVDDIDKSYIDQMQFQMMCTGAKQTYFVVYFRGLETEHMHEIIVPRDEERIAFIKERLDYAVERKEYYKQQIIKNSQI